MDPTDAQYGDAVQQARQAVEGGGLPVTGLDVFALVAVALALMFIGVALRRLKWSE